MKRGLYGALANRWGPYVLATVLLATDYALSARGLSHAGPGYTTWALDHSTYSDVVSLSGEHYLRGAAVIHPLPYVHDRIEYPVLLGFGLWLPTWLPGGVVTWFAVAGVFNTAATLGSIALIRRQHPPAAWWIAASPALLLDGAVNWDLIGIFFLVASVVWFGERRYRPSGAACAVGTCYKLFPVVVVPMALAALGSRWWRGSGRPEADADGTVGASNRNPASELARWLIPFGVVGAVAFLPFLALNAANTTWFVRFNDLRPQKDSIWDLLSKFVGRWAAINGTINTASLLIVMAAFGYGAWMVWRAADADQARAMALSAALAIVIWMMVNKVWNPQYVLWVFAAGAFTSMPARYAVALAVASLYDNWYEYLLRRPATHDLYLGAGQVGEALRAVVFLFMAAWVVIQLTRLVGVETRERAEFQPAPTPS